MKTKVTITASISDDDLCSDCIFCYYHPGEESECVTGFEYAKFDLDNYVISCSHFEWNEEPNGQTSN